MRERTFSEGRNERTSNRRRHAKNLHRPEFVEKGTRLVENGRKERLQTREKDDKREKREVEEALETWCRKKKKGRRKYLSGALRAADIPITSK